jgi:predicted permease
VTNRVTGRGDAQSSAKPRQRIRRSAGGGGGWRASIAVSIIMAALLHDVRAALRQLARDPRFSLAVVLTLATGIAATAVIFNVLNNTLLRPLPIADEARVFRLLDWTRGPDGEPVRRSTRALNYLAIRDRAKSFDTIVGMRAVNLPLDSGGTVRQAYVAMVSPGAFALLQARPVAGRLFTPAEEAAGADAGVLLVSHALWQQELGGRADAIGSTVRLDGRPHTVIGILGPAFRFPYRVDAWTPERVGPALDASLATLARLSRTVTPQQAQAELDAIAAAMERERPDSNRGLRYLMVPLREQLIGDQSRVTWSLFATAALLLALAAANAMNLLLARGARRTRQLAIVAALGASRGQQLRLLITESVLLSAAATVAGLLLAAMASGLVMNLVPLPLRTELGLGETAFDWRVAGFASAVTAVTAILAGLAPARRLSATDPIIVLRQQARGSSGPRRLMQALVIGEVALASILLLAAGLMADNLRRLGDAALGLDAEGLASVEIGLPPSRYATAESRIAIATRLVEAAQSLAGVERAGIVTVNPLDRGSFGAPIETGDRPLAPREAPQIVNHRLVSASWFAAAGLRLERGRFFDASDRADSPPVVIVSRHMAARLWPGVDAVGKQIRLARPNMPWMTVVGVVHDVRDFGEWRDTWYLPYAQQAGSFAGATLHLMLRTAVPADALARDLRHAARAIDPALPIDVPTPMTSMWENGLEQQRLAASASTLFAAAGSLLALIGTYGVLAYAVAARTRELGIRLALGAARRTMLVDVVGHGLRLAAAGLALGIGVGLAVNRALAAVAAESPGTSPRLIAAVIVALATCAAAAALIPALRATRIDPVDVMRAE